MWTHALGSVSHEGWWAGSLARVVPSHPNLAGTELCPCSYLCGSLGSRWKPSPALSRLREVHTHSCRNETQPKGGRTAGPGEASREVGCVGNGRKMQKHLTNLGRSQRARDSPGVTETGKETITPKLFSISFQNPVTVLIEKNFLSEFISKVFSCLSFYHFGEVVSWALADFYLWDWSSHACTVHLEKGRGGAHRPFPTPTVENPWITFDSPEP